MHSLVSIMQLAAIVAMSLIRSMLRTQRLGRDENLLRDRPDEVVGFELDWLAMQFGLDSDEGSTYETLWSVVVGAGPTSAETKNETTASRKEGMDASKSTKGVAANGKNKITESLDPVEEQPDVGNANNSTPTGPISLRTGSTVKMVDAADFSHLKASEPQKKHICPKMLFHRRARLAQLTNAPEQTKSGRSNLWEDQHVTARPFARQLKRAIETSADIIFQLSTMKESSKAATQFTWPLSASVQVNRRKSVASDRLNERIELNQNPLQNHRVQYCWEQESNLLCKVNLSLERSVAPDSKLSAWHTDQNSLEAVIGLWNWSMVSKHSSKSPDSWQPTASEAAKVPTERILAMASSKGDLQNAETNIRLWNEDFLALASTKRWSFSPEWHERSPNVVFEKDNVIYRADEKTVNGRSVRIFGWQAIMGVNGAFGSDDTKALALCHRVNDPLTSLCAQEVYVSFLLSILTTLDSIGQISVARSWTGRLVLKNDFVSKLAECFEESGLGTRQQGTLLITSALLSVSRLPFPVEAVPELLNTAKSEKMNERYGEAEKMLKWAFKLLQDLKLDGPETDGRRGLETIMVDLGELYRPLLYHENGSFAGQGIDWMRDVLEERSANGASDPVNEAIRLYIGVAERAQSKTVPSLGTVIAAILFNRREETLWLLTQHGIDISSPSPASWGAVISFASRQGWMEVVKALLALGVNINGVDEGRRTALSHAAEQGHIAIVKLLLQMNVMAYETDTQRRTPMSYAAATGCCEGSI